MPLFLVRKDITTMEVDAIVNAANESLMGGGGVDGAIHAAAGPALAEECRALGGCRPGEAKLTAGYRLPARHVIHTVGPRWQGGGAGEEATLRACYRNSLALARAQGFETLAFPLISAGIFGYPKAEALAVAEEEIRAFLGEADMTVYLTIFGSDALGRDRYPELRALLQPPAAAYDAFMGTSAPLPTAARETKRGLWKSRKKASMDNAIREAAPSAAALPEPGFPDISAEEEAPEGLREALSALDESFSQMLLRKITEKGMTDAQCYKKANIDRKLFSKIRSEMRYRPSKPTALAFAVALELGIEETKELLMKAGFALSRSSEFDVIVEYYIRRGQYDIDRINEALFAFDQTLLGSI